MFKKKKQSKKMNSIQKDNKIVKENNEIEEELEKPKNAKKTLKRLILSIKEEYKRLLIVMISIVFYTILTIVAPLYSAKIIDTLWNAIQAAMQNGMTFSITWEQGGMDICILLAIYAITTILYILQKFMMTSFSERLSLKLRKQISSKLNVLPLSYFDRHKPGEILSKATNDLDKMSEAIQTGLLTLFTSIGTVIGSIIMMFVTNYIMAITAILSSLIGFVLTSFMLTKIFTNKTLKYATKRQEQVEKLTAQVEECYSGRIIIQSFNQEEKSIENKKGRSYIDGNNNGRVS